MTPNPSLFVPSTETTINTAEATSYRLHKKRPSSTFLYPSGLHMDSSLNNNFGNILNSNHLHSPGYSYDDLTSLERSPKRKSIMRPWTNSEQESLYIAVEKYNLFGQWTEVQRRMNLNRTSKEIEEEYTRIYAEIPDSDQEWEMDHDGLEHNKKLSDNEMGPPTPSLTATSSGTPSARSSQDNMAMLFDRSKELSRYPALGKHQYGEDDEDADEEDMDDHQQQHHQQQQQKCQQQHLLHNPVDVRPARMVRVWTPEQSETLKNLIEVYFPGAYRINWVWVAAQMGNTFTRKQCKNKWEIMRRRMGTEDEINLLKQGYQEFGPSWGQIQEKYLPERSRGGISIMWDLLESRESEQQQQISNSRKLGPQTTVRSPYHGRYHSMSSLKSFQRPGNSKEATSNFDSLGSRNDQEVNPRRKRMVTSDPDSSDHPLLMLNSHSERVQSQFQRSHFDLGNNNNNGSRHMRIGSDIVSSHSSESWSDRNYPMTWTEPLTRRLEELVQQHFPNHQKVNWAKISSLMGNNPVVTRDQCKRRWYLISQNNNLNHNHNHRQGDDLAMSMDTDQTESTLLE